MRTVGLSSRANLMGVAAMTVALFGLMGNVMTDYNWGTNFLTNDFALTYAATLDRLTPFWPGASGIASGTYLGLFLLSFAILNRGRQGKVNFLETLRLASAVFILFEVGLRFFVPYFMDKWVIQVLYGTPLAAFTNWDLLGTGVVLFCLSELLLFKMRPAGWVEGP